MRTADGQRDCATTGRCLDTIQPVLLPYTLGHVPLVVQDVGFKKPQPNTNDGTASTPYKIHEIRGVDVPGHGGILLYELTLEQMIPRYIEATRELR